LSLAAGAISEERQRRGCVAGEGLVHLLARAIRHPQAKFARGQSLAVPSSGGFLGVMNEGELKPSRPVTKAISDATHMHLGHATHSYARGHALRGVLQLKGVSGRLVMSVSNQRIG
jgi:hypothetical protein